MRKTILKNAVLSLGIAFYSLSTFAILPALAGAKNGLNNGLKNEDRGDFPDGRVGGGTRSSGLCQESTRNLVVLNPFNNIGVTASDRPSIYVAVPKLNKLYPAEFFLTDADGNTVYETTLEIGQSQGFLVGIHLPKNTLKIGQDYDWDFVVWCNFDSLVAESSAVGGTLRQVSSDDFLEDDSTLEEHLDRIQSYQETGLWSDAIAASIELRRTYPNSDRVLNRWRQLLYALEFNNKAILEMLLEIQVPELQASE